MFAIITAVIALLALLVAAWWARCHREDLQAAGVMLDRHYEATQRLISDPETPDSVVDFSVRFAAEVGAPRIARRFAYDLVRGQLADVQPKGAGGSQRLAADLNRLGPKQRQAFGDMMANGMLASAASDPVLSRVYLTALNVFFSTSGRRGDKSVSVDRANTAALDISSRGLCHA